MKPLKSQYNNSIAIRLTSVSKRYTIHHEKPTLVEKLVNGKDEEFWALKDINLTIKKGERVGIIGPNGSGKTTLLKIIAGITTPTNGTVETHGKIVSLIDLESGFHPDLTGIQNIYLNGMLLGMSKQEIENKMNAIIAFADIGQFIDAPLFTYSTGMKLRLGLSIALYANPKNLVLDEGLGAGDEKFRKKVRHILETKYHGKNTIIVSTHNLEFITQQCSRIIIVKHGSITRDGGLETLIRYEKNKF